MHSQPSMLCAKVIADMASDLEADLRAAERNGFLTFSLVKLWDRPLWECNYRTTDSHQVFDERDADIVEALRKALRKGTADSRKKSKTTKAAAAEEVPKPRRRDAEDLA